MELHARGVVLGAHITLPRREIELERVFPVVDLKRARPDVELLVSVRQNDAEPFDFHGRSRIDVLGGPRGDLRQVIA